MHERTLPFMAYPSLCHTPQQICIMLEQKKQHLDLIPGQILPYPYYIGFYVFDKGNLKIIKNYFLTLRYKLNHFICLGLFCDVNI